MQELIYKDLESKGINTSTIKVCKKLRQLAKLDRLKLDETEHRSGMNKHIFDYIEYTGLDVLQFIKQYLSNLQPYMIERKQDQEKLKTFYCVLDNLYKISVYIKVDSKQFEEIVISFHEDNKRGVAKTNRLIKIDNEKYVPIFADEICSKISGENKYIVKAFFQRGMKILPIELPAVKYQDIFIVEKKAINQQFISYCNDYIRDLYTSDLNLDFDKIEVFSMLQQISFTSYGNDTFSSISLLIDSLDAQHDYNSKAVADCALVTFVQNLKLTEEQQNELKDLLDKKYLVSNIKKIDLILDRIKTNLSLIYNNELDTLAENANNIYNKVINNQ
jgi:hypothetical protein